MFKLIVKNKATGQTEQSDFKTQAECEAHKEYLKSIGYNFDDQTFDDGSVILATHEVKIEEDKKSEKLAQIAELEAKITPRRLRDALLGDKSFIEQVEAEIKAIRDSL